MEIPELRNELIEIKQTKRQTNTKTQQMGLRTD